MWPFNLFKKKPPIPPKKRFYNPAPPSLAPSELERDDLLRLLSNTRVDANFSALRAQARSLSTTSALLAGYFDTLDKEIFGDNGISLDLYTPNAELNTQIEQAFLAWRHSIPECPLSFWEVESLVLLHYKRDGEAFVYLNETPQGLSLAIIDPQNVDENADDGQMLLSGVEVDSLHNPVAYHIKRADGNIERVLANNIIHIFKRLNGLQTRGVTHLAPIIHPLYQKEKFKSAELKRARLQSEITGFFVAGEEHEIFPGVIEDLDNQQNPQEPKASVSERVEVGKMTYIEKNLKPYFTESHNATNIEFFIKQTDKEIAKALGVSYSTLTGDLNEVNYSSIRHGASEQRRQFRGLQNFLIRHLHNRIFKAWLDNEIKLGNIALEQRPAILSHFAFKPQGWEYIDPLKEMNANKVALETGQKSLSQILREQGKELDTHIAELKKEQEIYAILAARKSR
ncbi:portal protein [Helicobacter bizzozeronii CIII-1]|uniref:Portal protein n=1 Tax=Helicobacter bizzozeronii (strain CIII-1) TaxID=1002804 RepID=F8KQH0_HELBC|nr:phage portal protein [Helicobacter bizzozeronii]CCB80772.1 portal protein [Helicobacter bizzozeronii CIII-1]